MQSIPSPAASLRSLILALGIGGLLFVTMALADPRASAADSDRAEMTALVTRWVEHTWSPGTTPFDLDRVAELYATDDSLLAFDLMSPAQTVIRGWSDYQALWGPFMAGYDDWSLSGYDDLKVSVSGDTAWTAFTFTSSVQAADSSERLTGHWHATLGWERRDGAWRIVHEHISGPVR